MQYFALTLLCEGGSVDPREAFAQEGLLENVELALVGLFGLGVAAGKQQLSVEESALEHFPQRFLKLLDFVEPLIVLEADPVFLAQVLHEGVLLHLSAQPFLEEGDVRALKVGQKVFGGIGSLWALALATASAFCGGRQEQGASFFLINLLTLGGDLGGGVFFV